MTLNLPGLRASDGQPAPYPSLTVRACNGRVADNTPAIRVLSSIGEVCGPYALILSSLRFGTIMTIYSIESFRELLSTRSKRAMTALC
jgi:hypothetical protein